MADIGGKVDVGYFVDVGNLGEFGGDGGEVDSRVDG